MGHMAHDAGAHGAGQLTPQMLGAVSFQTSCQSQVRAQFNRGVALLHSFWLDEAEKTFRAVAARDPACAMAQWGVAMTLFNQVNGGPTAAGIVAANRALKLADAAREQDARERAYIHALHQFFDGFAGKDFQVFAARYADAMAQVAGAYPQDVEAQVFYALALINSEPSDEAALANKKKAVAILNPLFREHSRHPGIAHYLIHASDNPDMAQQGLEAAVRYAAIAPAAPHALHMPSHIFARLGLWQEDIRSNLASKAAAENPAEHVGAEQRLHAMHFLVYAYLQSGQYEQASAMAAEAKTVKAADVDPRYPDYYPIVEARLPALVAIETQDWTAAAGLPLQTTNWFTQAQGLLAHAIAAAHRHDPAAAKAAVDTLEPSVAAYPQVRARMPKATVPDEIRAWAQFAQGDLAGAVRLIEPVADRQDKLGEESVEVPAREMLAQMRALSGQWGEALRQYQGVLASDPNRFDALLGAGEAAENLGERDTAVNYYRTLLANCANANGAALERLRHAREIVAGTAVGSASGAGLVQVGGMRAAAMGSVSARRISASSAPGSLR